MAISEVSLSSADTTSGSSQVTSLSVTPTGYAIGDLLVAEFESVGGSATHTSTGAGSWTSVGDTGTVNSVARLSVWRWKATSTGGTFTFDLGGTARRATLSVRAFNGQDGSSPVEGTPDVGGAGGQTSYTHAAQTSSGSDRVWLLATGKNTVAGGTSTLNTPSGFTETADQCSVHTTNANANAGMDWKAVGSGSTGTQVVDSGDGSSRTWVGVSFLLKPASDIVATLGQVVENEIAQSIVQSGPIVANLGQVVETETAQAFLSNKVTLTQVQETETAQAVTLIRRVPVAQAIETEQSLPITVRETGYPVLGLWRNRPIDTGTSWTEDVAAAEAEFGIFQGHYGFYHAAGSNPMGAAQETALAQGKDIHLFWKPQAGGGTWKQVADGARDTTIDAAALDIKAKSPNKIWLTLHHEPENDVGATGSGMTATDYKNMWTHVRSRFDAAGVTNVIWVMVYMNSHAHPELMPSLYPGNSLVDIVSQQTYITKGVSASQIATKWIEDLDFLDTNSIGVGKAKAFTEWGADLGGNVATDRGTATHRADTIDAIRAILPTLASRKVVEIRYFDAGSNYLENKPSVDAVAFQALKDASEAGQTGPTLIPLGQALESEIAQPVTVQTVGTTIFVQVGQVVETELAQVLSMFKQGVGNVRAFSIHAPNYNSRPRKYKTEFAVTSPERT